MLQCILAPLWAGVLGLVGLWFVNVFGNQMCTIVVIMCLSNCFILWLNCAALRDKDD